MATTKTTKTAKPVEQVPASPPIRVEVRIDGRVRFSGDVYEPSFDVTDDTISFTADRNPTMVDKAPVRPPTRFGDSDDPRDGEKIIMKVHSGRRDLPPDPEPEESTDDD